MESIEVMILSFPYRYVGKFRQVGPHSLTVLTFVQKVELQWNIFLDLID